MLQDIGYLPFCGITAQPRESGIASSLFLWARQRLIRTTSTYMNRVHLEIKRIHVMLQDDKKRALKAFSRFRNVCNGEERFSNARERTHSSPREDSFATSKIKLIARLSLLQQPTSITNLPPSELSLRGWRRLADAIRAS